MRALPALVCLSILAGCDATPPGAGAACTAEPLVRSSLVACVTGDLDVEISGALAAGGWGDPGVPYDLWAVQTGGSSVSGGADLYVYLPNGGTLVAGTYPVQAGPVPPGPFESRPDTAAIGTGAAVVYTPRPGGGVEVWRVVSGEIVVEVAEAGGQQSGRFDLVGVEGGRQIRAQGRFQRL